MSAILDFYRGIGTDSAGRTREQVANLSLDELESVHDWVQHAFPSTEPSRFQPQTPVLTPEDVAEFQADPVNPDGVLRTQMLTFLGRTWAFYQSTDNWKSAHDHNHFRITRILKFVNLMDPVLAQKLLKAFLDDCGPLVPETTKQFWRDAAPTV